ncbi:MAG: PspA/IM30 family protein [bacterium]|nr:PspA/IM30 family protein [bacterium]
MADLFKKLNTLVKASVNDWLNGERPAAAAPRPLTRERLGVGVEREIAALRQRIEDAAAYQDTMRRQIAALDSEIAALDRQADEAVERGDQASARFFVEQLQRAERRQVMLNSDLSDHEYAAAELREKVDQMEAMVEQAKQSQSEAEPINPPLPNLADVLRRAQDTITSLAEVRQQDTPPAAPDATDGQEQTAVPPAEPDSSTPAAVDSDLERRRQRLSKKD